MKLLFNPPSPKKSERKNTQYNKGEVKHVLKEYNCNEGKAEGEDSLESVKLRKK